MRRTTTFAGLALTLVASTLVACASETVDDGGEGGAPMASGGSSSTTGGSTAAGGSTGGGDTGGSGGGSGGGAPFTPDVMLPFAVDDHFVPSGFMGREDPGGAKEVEGIVFTPDVCPERPEGAEGTCHEVTYTPQALDSEVNSTWAGVFWQSSDKNWGELQGNAVEPGATKIVFTAWAEAPLDIQFLAGGIGDLSSEYQDTFKVTSDVSLTTELQEFELDLSNSSYQYVIGGFGWVIEASSTDPIVFYIDDIRWVK